MQQYLLRVSIPLQPCENHIKPVLRERYKIPESHNSEEKEKCAHPFSFERTVDCSRVYELRLGNAPCQYSAIAIS
jgi:hypothetical protein